MIIEGRHTEAGRGIFVSDLQEGSAAEQVRSLITVILKLNDQVINEPRNDGTETVASTKILQHGRRILIC